MASCIKMTPKKTAKINNTSKPLIRRALFNSGRTLTAASLTSLPLLQSHVERITVNVGGQKYQIPKNNLEGFPDTLLSSNTRMQFYDKERNEYFFDRDPLLFKYIVEYYRTGQFHLADSVCQEAIEDELAFFGIPKEHVSHCCCDRIDFEEKAAANHYTYTSSDRELSNYLGGQVFGITTYETSRRAKLYKFLTEPNYTLCSSVYSYILAVVIILNICTINAETIDCEEKIKCVELNPEVFFVLDSFCVIIFTFEYFARLYAVEYRWKFVKELSNVLDLIGVLPYYVSVIARVVNSNDRRLESFLTILRVLRIFRITKLARHSARFLNLLRSIRDAAKELGGILFSFFLVMVTFSSLIYFFEKGTPGTLFTSIPAAFWYTIVTMTTLGYGDMVPETLRGKLIGSCCSLVGVLLLALPVPIIEEKLNKFKPVDRPKRDKTQIARELPVSHECTNCTDMKVEAAGSILRHTNAGRSSLVSSSSSSYHSSVTMLNKPSSI